MIAHEDLRNAGLPIFANKQDVKEHMTVAKISQFFKITSSENRQWNAVLFLVRVYAKDLKG